MTFIQQLLITSLTQSSPANHRSFSVIDSAYMLCLFIEASFLQAKTLMKLGILLTSYDYLRSTQFSTNTDLTNLWTPYKTYCDDDMLAYILPTEMKSQINKYLKPKNFN
jgi:hypothetical protein